jgi:hypothetical protein
VGPISGQSVRYPLQFVEFQRPEFEFSLGYGARDVIVKGVSYGIPAFIAVEEINGRVRLVLRNRDSRKPSPLCAFNDVPRASGCCSGIYVRNS